jgi:hypothetical protein
MYFFSFKIQMNTFRLPYLETLYNEVEEILEKPMPILYNGGI